MRHDRKIWEMLWDATTKHTSRCCPFCVNEGENKFQRARDVSIFDLPGTEMDVGGKGGGGEARAERKRERGRNRARRKV